MAKPAFPLGQFVPKRDEAHCCPIRLIAHARRHGFIRIKTLDKTLWVTGMRCAPPPQKTIGQISSTHISSTHTDGLHRRQEFVCLFSRFKEEGSILFWGLLQDAVS